MSDVSSITDEAPKISETELVKRWLKSIFPEIDDALTIGEIVESGVVLCNLANKVSPGAISKIDTRQISFVYGSNIS